jgi:hypothetical protein
MAQHNYLSFPAIYLGSAKEREAKEQHDTIMQVYLANKDRFSSLNQFLRHCLVYGAVNDDSLKSL